MSVSRNTRRATITPQQYETEQHQAVADVEWDEVHDDDDGTGDGERHVIVRRTTGVRGSERRIDDLDLERAVGIASIMLNQQQQSFATMTMAATAERPMVTPCHVRRSRSPCTGR